MIVTGGAAQARRLAFRKPDPRASRRLRGGDKPGHNIN